MKKLILFLLLPLWAMAQTSNGQEQEFDYGIKNNSTQTITTPPYLGTFGTDGTQGKIPSAYIEKTDNKQNSLAVDGTGTKYPTVDAVNAALPKTYTTTVYVNANDPNIATIFDDENPPTVNDNTLKSNTDNLYIGLDASAWVYSGGEYVTKIIPASSNFYIYSTSIDAGNNKSSTIERFGEIVSKSGNIVRRDGSDSVGGGGYFSFYNNAITSGNTFQLNASNGVDLWNYSSGVWNKRFTFSSAGYLTATNGQLIGGTGTAGYVPKFTGGGSIGDSSIADNGILVTINNPLVVSEKITSSGGDLTLSDSSGSIFRGVRDFSWNDNVNTRFFQVGDNADNVIFTSKFGSVMSRMLFSSMKTQFSTSVNTSVVAPLGIFEVLNNASNVAFSVATSGNVLINTTTDNGIDQLQANGSISATNYTGSATLTGTPTAPTAAPGTTGNQIATVDYVQGAKSITVRKISTNTTLSDSDNGKVILLTASCTVTLPNGLMSGFNCSFATQAGATLTYSLGGSVVLINNAGTTMGELSSHTIVNTGTTNEYLTVGL